MRRQRAPAKRSGAAGRPATLPDSDEAIRNIAEQCRKRVTQRALLSAGASVVPLPGFDVAVDVGVLARMLHEVNQAFGLTPTQIAELSPRRRITVFRAIDTLGASAVGRWVTREVVALVARSVARRFAAKLTLRYVPLAGQAMAATISFAALKALGDRHVADCVRVAHAVRARGAVGPSGRAPGSDA